MSKRSKVARVKRATKSPNDGPNPYRAGSDYGVLFEMGSKKFQPEADLIKAVAAKTGKSQKKVGFNLAVLKSPGHSSNGQRSGVETNAQGQIKLVDKRVLVGGKKPAAAKKTVVTKQTVAPKAPAAPAPATPAAPVATPAAAPAATAETK